jgi:hypothetical protein
VQQTFAFQTEEPLAGSKQPGAPCV